MSMAGTRGQRPQGGGEGRRGGGARGRGRLPAEMYRIALLLPEEDHANFASRRRCRGRAPRPWAGGEGAGRGRGRPDLRAARPGVFHNSAVVLDADGRVAGLYRRCTSPTTRSSTRSSTSPRRPRLPGLRRPAGRIGILICGPVVPRRRAAHRLRGRPLFYPTAIGWHPARRPRTASPSARPGRRSSVRTRSRTGVYVAVVNRVGRESRPRAGRARFWARAFLADPFGIVIQEASTDREEVWSAR